MASVSFVTKFSNYVSFCVFSTVHLKKLGRPFHLAY
jgi:hypothetical protein